MVRIYIFEVTITFVYVSFMKTIHIRMIEKKNQFSTAKKIIDKKKPIVSDSRWIINIEPI